ncbi:CDP-diacylglycerol--inositol 3-phosphatidyltransferase [Pezoporus wallicus]|uniref:CDP-diacylglycerol--inositol 3-phosphatidyltransferase n=1 Tax=Pezoporus wallicus TaxID=35540 RepID=UPI00254D3D7E|nr:CDP-diacylglycerol--inositol 3-phosphatidyltransferase [Pezoporus wallicus]XP_061300125.1 CDP-diacylglycerol--inositol 3-phosphatidyltransferase [Pezoporus flaviventris]
MAGGDNVFLFVPNVIGYFRIALAAASFYLMPTAPGPAAACYGLSGLLDAVDGHAARALGQGSRLGAMLDMLTDRLSSMCLLLNLALLYPTAAPLFQLSMALDVASHWLHMHCTTLEGGRSHKAVGGTTHPVLRLYYSSKALLFLLCAGNEGFYGCLYLLHFGEGPAVLPGGPGLFRAGLWVTAPLALLKGALNLVQLGGAARRLAAIDRAERAKGQ